MNSTPTNEFPNPFPYNLNPLLHPKSIAILGASQNADKIVGKPLYFLQKHGYAGKIYPVNPKYKEISGIPCYPSLAKVPGEIDVVLIGLPAEGVLGALRECAARGVKSALVFASGFAEVGGEGVKMQEDLRDFAQQSGIALCGPNCQGVINLSEGAAASFTLALERHPLRTGKSAFITQSGALGGALFTTAQEMGLGFSYWVSTGNEAVLESADYMHYMVQDPKTEIILGYIEGFRNLEKLRHVAREALERRKPIVILKVGKSEVGTKASSLHTGAVTGSGPFYENLFREIGILQVRDVDELFDVGSMLSVGKLPQGNGVGIITISGGAGVLFSDLCAEEGLTVPPLEGETREKMLKLLPPFGSALNPVDITAQSRQLEASHPDLYKDYLRVLLRDPRCHSVIFILTAASGKRGLKIARDIVDIFPETEKPMAVAWFAGNVAQDCYEILEKAGVPLFRAPGRCVRAMGALAKYSQFLRNLQG